MVDPVLELWKSRW